MPFSTLKIIGRVLACLLLAPLLNHSASAQSRSSENSADQPLSPAQTALFDTPHLANVTKPETLHYAYHRTGPGSFDDTISVRVKKVNTDGTRDLSFDYLSGDHHVAFPEIDSFHGNPVFMLALEHDVSMMHEALKLSAASLRNRIRGGFVDAPVTDGTFTLPTGATTPARIITVEPFAHEARLERLPSLQQKTYRFVLADAVPGQIAEIDIDTPADAGLGAPAMSEKISFTGAEP